jgi:hypothetical protein
MPTPNAFLSQAHTVACDASTDLWEVSERLSTGALRDWIAARADIGADTLSREWRLGGAVLGCHIRAADGPSHPSRYVMTWTVNGHSSRRRSCLEAVAQHLAAQDRCSGSQSTPTA